MGTEEVTGIDLKSRGIYLWLSRDKDLWANWSEMARQELRDAEDAHGIADPGGHFVIPKRECATRSLADRLRSEINGGVPLEDGMYKDLLHAALNEVDWLKVADAITRLVEQVDGE